jgi:hypothetical protein
MTTETETTIETKAELKEAELKKPTLAERREALVQECSIQRTHLSREIAAIRAPSLHGGGIVQTLTSGRMKIPLAIIGLVVGMIASRRSAPMPAMSMGLTVYNLAKSVLRMVKARAA